MLLKHFFSTALLLAAFSARAAQDLPWHLGAVDTKASAPAAINTNKIPPGPHRVVVAVIDSGILAGHPSLNGQLLPGYDMLS